MRRLAAGALQASGYDVLVAQSGDEALQLAVAHPGPVDLVITNVPESAKASDPALGSLTTRFPDVQVLYTSGYPANTLPKLGRGTAVLRKPYTPVTLTSKVRDVLDRRD